MKLKSLGIALGMAVGLFFYGYFLSTAGHDHSAHGNGHQEKQEETIKAHDEGHDDHDHSHH